MRRAHRRMRGATSWDAPRDARFRRLECTVGCTEMRLGMRCGGCVAVRLGMRCEWRQWRTDCRVCRRTFRARSRRPSARSIVSRETFVPISHYIATSVSRETSVCVRWFRLRLWILAAIATFRQTRNDRTQSWTRGQRRWLEQGDLRGQPQIPTPPYGLPPPYGLFLGKAGEHLRLGCAAGTMAVWKTAAATPRAPAARLPMPLAHRPTRAFVIKLRQMKQPRFPGRLFRRVPIARPRRTRARRLGRIAAPRRAACRAASTSAPVRTSAAARRSSRWRWRRCSSSEGRVPRSPTTPSCRATCTMASTTICAPRSRRPISSTSRSICCSWAPTGRTNAKRPRSSPATSSAATASCSLASTR